MKYILKMHSIFFSLKILLIVKYVKIVCSVVTISVWEYYNIIFELAYAYIFSFHLIYFTF